MSEPDILATTDAGIGRIRLNRPRQINALTVPMMRSVGLVSGSRRPPQVRYQLFSAIPPKANTR